VGDLRGAGYDVIGDLGDLQAQPAGQPATRPADEPAGRMLDAAVEAAAALVVTGYRRQFPAVSGRAAGPQRAAGGRRGLVHRVESAVAASPRLKRTVRELSSRSAAVRRLRIVAWRAMERRRLGGHR
jgi:hypothetical protein